MVQRTDNIMNIVIKTNDVIDCGGEKNSTKSRKYI